MRILAIDQSTRCSGLAWSDGPDDVPRCTMVKTPSKLKGVDAMDYQAATIAVEMRAISGDGAWHLALEGMFVQPGRLNWRTLFLLGRLYEAIRREAMTLGVDGVSEIHPTAICTTMGLKITTPRDVKKRAARIMAAQLLGLGREAWQAVDENVADAVMLLRAAQVAAGL